jgi:hypothetical protein
MMNSTSIDARHNSNRWPSIKRVSPLGGRGRPLTVGRQTQIPIIDMSALSA